MVRRSTRSLYLASSDGETLKVAPGPRLGPVAETCRADEPISRAEADAFEAIWKQARADAAELKAEAARFRASR